MLMALYIAGLTMCSLIIPNLLMMAPGARPGANIYLVLFTGCIGVILLEKLLLTLGLHDTWPHLNMSVFSLYFAMGPLLYFYVLAMSDRGFHWRHTYVIHFTPALLCIVVLLPFYTLTADEKLVQLAHYTGVSYGGRRFLFWALIPFSLSIFTYSLLGFRRLVRHKRDIREEFSALEGRTLNWLLYFCGFGMVVALGLIPPPLLLGVETLYQNSVMVAALYFIGIRSLSQRTVYEEQSAGEEQPGQEEEPSQHTKYQKSGLTPDEERARYQQLVELMTQERPYLEPTLSLGDLATQLDISGAHLSQALNSGGGISFFDLVNQYRVNYAKELIERYRGEKVALIAVAMESGFNSKTSFYQQFKKYTGMTPAKFRDS